MRPFKSADGGNQSKFHERKSSAWRKRAFAFLVQRDGENCRECGCENKQIPVNSWGYFGTTEEGYRFSYVRLRPLMEIDHIVPLHAFGTNDYENLQLLCHHCHKAKSSKERAQMKHYRQLREAAA